MAIMWARLGSKGRFTTDGFAAAGEAKLGITAEIADEDDLVDQHCTLPTGGVHEAEQHAPVPSTPPHSGARTG